MPGRKNLIAQIPGQILENIDKYLIAKKGQEQKWEIEKLNSFGAEESQTYNFTKSKGL